jgi:hypothetical protein
MGINAVICLILVDILLINLVCGCYLSCLEFSFLAEELPIFLHVCVFYYYTMLIRVCIQLGQSQKNYGHA